MVEEENNVVLEDEQQSEKPPEKKSRGASIGKLMKKLSGPVVLEWNKYDQPCGKWKKYYVNQTGVLARRIDINIDLWKHVDQGLKDTMWLDLKQSFTIKDSMKAKVISYLGSRWTDFKSILTSTYIFKTRKSQRKKQLDDPTEMYEFTPEQWNKFVKDRKTEEFQARRTKAQTAQKENIHLHYLGSAGYNGKMDQWYVDLVATEAASSGDPAKAVETATNLVEDRGYRWLKAHTPINGQAIPVETQEVIDRIKQYQEKASRGEFVSNGMNDILAAAMDKEDRPGRTRGVGGRVGLQAVFGKPTGNAAHGRRYTDEEMRSFAENIKRETMLEMEKKMEERFAEFMQYQIGVVPPKIVHMNKTPDTQQADKHNTQQAYKTNMQQADKPDTQQGQQPDTQQSDQVDTQQGDQTKFLPNLTSRTRIADRTRSRPQANIDSQPDHTSCQFPTFDGKKGPLFCELYYDLPNEGLVVVAKGMVSPQFQGNVHCVPLRPDHCRVTIDEAIKPLAPIPVPFDDQFTVGEVVGSNGQWPKKWISVRDDKSKYVSSETAKHVVKPVSTTSSVKKRAAEQITHMKNSAKKNKKQISSQSCHITSETNESHYVLPSSCRILSNLLRKAANLSSYQVQIFKDVFQYNEDTQITISAEDINKMFELLSLNTPILQIWGRYLYEIAKAYGVHNLAFMCPEKLTSVADSDTENAVDYFEEVLSRCEGRKFILGAYSQENHWMLIVISPETSEVYFMDPQASKRKINFKVHLNLAFRCYCQKGGNHDVRKGTALTWHDTQCQQQEDDFQSAYYVMKFMYDIVLLHHKRQDLKECFAASQLKIGDMINQVRENWSMHFMNSCI